jgi:hypothetical protein
LKIKQDPEDFYVEEISDVKPGARGDFALYRLEKRGWTTPDALLTLRRRWHLGAGRLSYGGFKDRHAHTVQYLTILRGPARRLTQPGINCQHLGYLQRPFKSQDIRANHFRLVLRSFSQSDAQTAAATVVAVTVEGVPNYFDDQRFGSVFGSEFVAKALVCGDFERALWLALAAPYAYDRAAQKRQKAFLANTGAIGGRARTHWRTARRGLLFTTWPLAPETLLAPSCACNQSSARFISRHTRATYGTECWLAGYTSSCSLSSCFLLNCAWALLPCIATSPRASDNSSRISSCLCLRRVAKSIHPTRELS